MIVMIFAIPFLPFAWLLTIPLARAYVDGIKFARDPTHRVTTRGAWFFFDDFVKRRIRRWVPVWGVLLVLSLGTLTVIREHAFYDLWGGGISPLMRLGVSSVFSEVLLNFALMNYVGFMILAPRVSGVSSLMFLTMFVALLLNGILTGAPWIIMALVAPVFASPIPPQFLCVAHILVAQGVRASVRSRGDDWFAIEG